MPVKTIEVGDFLKMFSESLDFGFEHAMGDYTLVLGAGASRSAGIPTAKEMMEIFKRIATYRRRSIKNPDPEAENDWSYLFEAAFGPDDYDNPFEGEDQEFIARAIALSSREPNLTNLIAANLAALQIFPVIVTTNYDDLLLAGFWNLPARIPFNEPHVIYNPRDKFSYNPLDGASAPIVIKAHGHHTDYWQGLGIMNHQVQELAPYVKKAIKRQPRPRIGYVVVGYSGDWRDGIMEAFNDKSLMHGTTVYWFYLGDKPPEIDKKIWRTANLFLVRCDDSDFLFLNMWHETQLVFQEASLEAGELFGPLQLKDRVRKREPDEPEHAWWVPDNGRPFHELTDIERRKSLHLDVLADKLVPILDQCVAWEQKRISDWCLPSRIDRGHDVFEDVDFSADEPPGIDALRSAVPARVSWGRRDRCLLRLALHPEIDPDISREVLGALTKFN